MLPKFISRTVYQSEQSLIGRGKVQGYFTALSKTQYLPADQLSQLQWEKLIKLLNHAYKTVPYYQTLFRNNKVDPQDIRSYSDFIQIPYLTRNDIRDNSDNLVSRIYSKESLIQASSSGTSGQPVTFYQTREFQLWARAHQLRNYHWCGGYEVGDRFALLWGSELFFRLKTIRDHIENILQNRLELNTFRLSKQSVLDYARKLSRFRPHIISSYPSALVLIGNLVRLYQIKEIKPKAIQTTAETLTIGDRKFLCDVFECDIYDKYGARETNVIAHECPLHQGMHINTENVFIEFLRDDLPVSDGEIGEIVITNLNNFGMPLIRYKIGDWGSPLAGQCVCQITLPRMNNVKGRLSDIIVAPDGSMIDPYFFSYLLQSFKEIDTFQVVQENHNELIIKLVQRMPVVKESFEKYITEAVHKFTDQSFVVAFQYLDSIPVESSGKRRLTISKIPLEW